MKKVLFMAMAAAMMACSGSNKSEQAQPAAAAADEAQEAAVEMKGKFESFALDGFKLHVYNTNDVMANTSVIIEGNDSLVVMEYPLFKENEKEIKSFIEKLGKPLAADVTSYHFGGSNTLPLTMPEGMWAFIVGPTYSGMMKGFTDQWGDQLVNMPTREVAEVPFDQTQRWDGIDFKFIHGPANEMPAASIIIGGQVFYAHWVPAKAHMSPMQLRNVEAIDSELEAAKVAADANCKYYVGGHGGVAGKAEADFKVAYLTKVKELRAEKADAAAFAEALKAAYPDLTGDVDALAQGLYK